LNVATPGIAVTPSTFRRTLKLAGYRFLTGPVTELHPHLLRHACARRQGDSLCASRLTTRSAPGCRRWVLCCVIWLPRRPNYGYGQAALPHRGLAAWSSSAPVSPAVYPPKPDKNPSSPLLVSGSARSAYDRGVATTTFATRAEAQAALFRYIDGWYNPPPHPTPQRPLARPVRGSLARHAQPSQTATLQPETADPR
jgi:hypothetical protein